MQGKPIFLRFGFVKLFLSACLVVRICGFGVIAFCLIFHSSSLLRPHCVAICTFLFSPFPLSPLTICGLTPRSLLSGLAQRPCRRWFFWWRRSCGTRRQRGCAFWTLFRNMRCFLRLSLLFGFLSRVLFFSRTIPSGISACQRADPWLICTHFWAYVLPLLSSGQRFPVFPGSRCFYLLAHQLRPFLSSQERSHVFTI